MAVVHVIHESVLGCKTVAFDEHALKRMKLRGVSEDEVLDVLRNPDVTGLKADYDRLHYRKYRDISKTKWISVVFEHDPTQIVVMTVIVH